MTDTIQRDSAYVAHTYARFPVELVKGEGPLLYDAEGKRYIDMGSGIGVTAFGIADPLWKEAVIAQIDQLTHVSNLYYTQPCATLAQMLCEKTGMKKVFFSNSGAEANECAIKAARKYAAQVKGAEYTTIITLENSFHGRTITTLAATGQDHYHQDFQPLTPGFVHAKANDLEGLKALVEQHKAAAILLECIQGEGGVIPLTKEFLQGAAALAKEKDILLLIDEVQTGNGRTGELYAYMHFGITPDIVSTAKGLGGGLPLGATLFGEKTQNVLQPGDHGSTFGGNPVCCAGAVSILSRLDEGFLAQVKEKEALIRESLAGAPGIENITGMGLMLGIQTVKPVAEVLSLCREKGVLCLSAKSKLRLLPPLNIPKTLLAEALTQIKAACDPNQ